MKIFRFVKKVFFLGLTILSNFTNVNSLLNFISMKNQECKTRPQVINVNSNNPLFYPFSIKTTKCSGNCNNINTPYANICVSDVIKDLNVKVFNLCQELMKQDLQNSMKNISVNVYQMQMFIIKNNVGIKINVDVNVKN